MTNSLAEQPLIRRIRPNRLGFGWMKHMHCPEDDLGRRPLGFDPSGRFQAIHQHHIWPCIRHLLHGLLSIRRYTDHIDFRPGARQ